MRRARVSQNDNESPEISKIFSPMDSGGEYEPLVYSDIVERNANKRSGN